MELKPFFFYILISNLPLNVHFDSLPVMKRQKKQTINAGSDGMLSQKSWYVQLRLCLILGAQGAVMRGEM